ncbi:MAG: helix-turn-helix domain-containing protein [Flavobacterium sp. JAD_PAG50586_2]|nr:MAG: helix-turn-helix domain-containing protein [Flavobacterium sp. JAD_PAG50586_2]
MIAILNYLSLGASFLLSFLLLINPQKVNQKANRWFGGFALCLFFLFLENTIYIVDINYENQLLFDFLTLPSLIINPLLYLSVVYFVTPEKQWQNKDYLHFCFALLMILLIVSNVALNNKEIFINHTSNNITILLHIIYSIQLFAYLLFTYLKITNHQKNLAQFSSTVESVDLKWLKNIIISIIIMSPLCILSSLFNFFPSSSHNFEFFKGLISLIGLFYIAFYSMKQKEIYPFNTEDKKQINSIIHETNTYDEIRKKLISDSQLKEYVTDLSTIMKTEKPFLECELSLVKLASRMNISTHLLSYIINKGFNENFYQFINRYRIEEAKKLIVNPQMNHLSFQGIGFEVGFNSKTVFNTTFKKCTGQTPSEFKKLQYCET